MSVQDRYYNKKEYDALTPAQKFGLKLKYNQRNDKKQKDDKGKKVDLSACSIKAVAAALQDSSTGGGGGEETESSDEDDDEVAQMKPPSQKKQKQGTGNRNHSALQRQNRS